MSPYLTVHMTAEQMLKNSYPRMFRNAFLIAIGMHALAFFFLPEFKVKPYELREKREIAAIDDPGPDQDTASSEGRGEAAGSGRHRSERRCERGGDDRVDRASTSTLLPSCLPRRPGPSSSPSFDEAPQVDRQVPPEYPEMARQSELEGVVLVQIGVNEFGDVMEARVAAGRPGLESTRRSRRS